MTIQIPESLIPSNTILMTNAILAATAIIINITCIIAIAKESRRMLKSFEILLINLMATDIVVAVSAVLLAIAFLCDLREISKTGFTVIAFTFVATSQEMSLIVLFISLNRLVAVKYPLRHRFGMTKLRTIMASGIIWLLFLVYLSVMLIVSMHREPSDNPFEIPDAPRITFITMTCTFMVILIATNIETLRLISRRGVTIQRAAPSSAGRHSHDRLLSITTTMIIICFCLCTAPRVYQLARKKGEVGTVTALLVNTLMNPLLYFVNARLRRRLSEANRSSQIKSGDTT